MKKFKKALCIVLAGIMVLGASACNKEGETGSNNGGGNGSNGGGGSAAANEAAKQYVYASEIIDLGIDTQNLSMYNMTYMDGRIYAVVEDYGNVLGGGETEDVAVAEPRTAVAIPEVDPGFGVEIEEVVEEDTATEEGTDGDYAIDDDMAILPDEYVYYGPSYYLISVKLDGSDQQIHKLNMDEKLVQGYMSGINMLSDGSVAAIYENYFEDLTDPVNPVYMTNFYLMKWDNQGKLLWTTDLTDEDGNYIYAQTMLLDEAGNLTIVTGDSQIITVDAQGKETGRTKMEDTIVNNMGQMITKSDGTMFITSYDDNWTKMFISTFDIKTGQVGEKKELPSNLVNYSIFAGNTTDFVLSNSFGIFTYNLGDAEPVKIMDFINSDLATYGLYNVSFIDDKTFVAKYYDSTEYKENIAKFTYVDPSTIPDKTSFVLGCEYLGSDVKKRVIDFNKTNTKYRITLKEYSSYNTMDDYTLASAQMNNDIISGKMPDVMLIDSSHDISSWANKGLLADVTELIAKDSELSQVEFLQNVWDAFKVNDKLYTVVPSFSVQTMTARKDLVGDRTGWTMSEFVSFMKTQDPNVKPFGDDMLRDTILYYIMTYCGSDFVNINTGECNFSSPEFVAMLEYANTFPKEFSEDYWNDYDWTLTQSQYREKKAVLLHTYINRIQDLVYNLHGTLGGEAAFVGYPGISGNSSVIQPGSNLFVLSAKSGCIEGAWEFVRYYLTDEYQNSEELYTLPVSKKAFEEQAKKGMDKPYWIDENGEKVEYDQTFWMNDEEIILEPFTQAEVDAICEFIYSVNKRSYYNQDIINIVTEEAESYFEGQKSAQDVANLIQNRVQLYVDENR